MIYRISIFFITILLFLISWFKYLFERNILLILFILLLILWIVILIFYLKKEYLKILFNTKLYNFNLLLLAFQISKFVYGYFLSDMDFIFIYMLCFFAPVNFFLFLIQFIILPYFLEEFKKYDKTKENILSFLWITFVYFFYILIVIFFLLQYIH